MKVLAISAALALWTTAVNADDLYKVDAQLTVSGNKVGAFTTELPAGAFSKFENTQHRPYTASLAVKDNKVTEKVEKDLATGFTLTSTAITTTDGKVLFTYAMDYSRLIKMTRKPVAGANEFIDLPETWEIGHSGSVLFTDGAPVTQSGGNSTDQWELKMTVTKI